MKYQTKLLATGHLGFVGTALQGFLQKSDQAVAWCPLSVEHDILDPATLRDMLREHEPDWIIHLAAQSHVPASWADPAATLRLNVCGTANLLQALTDTGFRGRMLYVSSADVYGAVPEDKLPVTEEVVPAPRSPYATSKVAAEMLCRQWVRTLPLDVVIARPFNHTGPGQRADFALPAFAREVAAIKLGLQAPRVAAGDLNVTRDFLDVNDVISAYLALLAKGVRGDIYNVCSGREVHLGDALKMLVELSGIDAEIAVDPARLRPTEQRRMCGSHAKLTTATGWQPEVELRETLTRLTEYWIQELDR